MQTTIQENIADYVAMFSDTTIQSKLNVGVIICAECEVESTYKIINDILPGISIYKPTDDTKNSASSRLIIGELEAGKTVAVRIGNSLDESLRKYLEESDEKSSKANLLLIVNNVDYPEINFENIEFSACNTLYK